MAWHLQELCASDSCRYTSLSSAARGDLVHGRPTTNKMTSWQPRILCGRHGCVEQILGLHQQYTTFKNRLKTYLQSTSSLTSRVLVVTGYFIRLLNECRKNMV